MSKGRPGDRPSSLVWPLILHPPFPWIWEALEIPGINGRYHEIRRHATCSDEPKGQKPVTPPRHGHAGTCFGEFHEHRVPHPLPHAHPAFLVARFGPAFDEAAGEGLGPG